MEGIIFTFIKFLFFLWLLEKILKVKIISPTLHFGKITVEWTLCVLTAAWSTVVALSAYIAKYTPAVVGWLRGGGARR
jgi:hypothetical protein